MPELKGLDIAWARPSTAQILATGAHWVARYFSTDLSKDLTAAEVHDYPAAGLAVVTVWETTTGRATQGRAAGIADARAAEARRRAVGLPDTHVHHFAVDEDTSWASVQAYFDGAASVVGSGRVGCYGGFPVIEGAAAHGIKYLWQTTAWSGGRWSSHATIRQTGATALSGGADVDQAEVPDFGQFPRPVPLTPPEVDMTPDELLTKTVPDLALPDPKHPGQFLQTPVGHVFEYAALRHQQVLSAVQQTAAQVGALTATITALAHAVGSGGGLTAEQITTAAQAGATAALTQLGHALDGTPATH